MREEKKKRTDTKSIFEHLKKDETTGTLQNQIEEYLNQMSNLNLIFNNKTDQGLVGFYKTTEKDEAIQISFKKTLNMTSVKV